MEEETHLLRIFVSLSEHGYKTSIKECSILRVTKQLHILIVPHDNPQYVPHKRHVHSETIEEIEPVNIKHNYVSLVCWCRPENKTLVVGTMIHKVTEMWLTLYKEVQQIKEHVDKHIFKEIQKPTSLYIEFEGIPL